MIQGLNREGECCPKTTLAPFNVGSRAPFWPLPFLQPTMRQATSVTRVGIKRCIANAAVTNGQDIMVSGCVATLPTS